MSEQFKEQGGEGLGDKRQLVDMALNYIGASESLLERIEADNWNLDELTRLAEQYQSATGEEKKIAERELTDFTARYAEMKIEEKYGK